MHLYSPNSHASTVVLGALGLGEERALGKANPESRCWLRLHSLDECIQRIESGGVERVLLFQARPGELPQDAPQRLRDADPDINLLSVFGAWCEGELRTGRPWDDVRRIPWHQLPRDACVGHALPDLFVLVNCRSAPAAQLWADVLEPWNAACVWARRGCVEPIVRGVNLAVWDGDQLDGLEMDQLSAFCQQRRTTGTPVVAAFDYPRADTVEAALNLGVSVVLARPWTLTDLSSALSAAFESRPATSPAVAEEQPPAARAA